MNFKKYIKAVGTGPKGNRDLEAEEVIDAISSILDNKVTQSQIGAFLIAWRTKLETNDELIAAVKALKKYVKYQKIENSIELGYSFDGRTNNPFLFPLYENILKEFFEKNKDVKELNLVISGDFLQPAKNGITTKEVFNSLDLKQHVFFFDRVEYLKELSDITPLRHELGLRTVFNTIEKLLNPGESEYGVTTAFHKPYVKKYLAMFKEYYKEVLVVKASEGSPEVFKDGKYWKEVNGEIVEIPFSLKDFGISYDKTYENITLEEALEIVKNPDEEIIKLAKFNIALYLVFAKRVDSLEEAWKRLN
ncbi:glycosyl transferase [Poseidonibacter ostreae]|jgi:anthranilate phosphoribosyltransferase|uniref:Glycosyl transferase n=1 Tax=Poseidonibacter ostreae TaxID=2654171 RepID=A0A6L4WWQ1_9BACT|nr:glycosyl transferase [Poseidonibacter ostreae]KAB7888027.1 glycosyl transferase [Poseidonibacter ostreae]KAB7891054.1 glycosyl transferase [Poseidonibacter ostreae]KAB7892778.1 glycosyl transferase [Poseidonibacter ostreae]MAC83568.1 glycosyl transferase [Arcobacter sp.]|tara:strand:+ start:4750 stop:5667 length:918 start_codon:yes stop_codon:yes gene_type:complete